MYKLKLIIYLLLCIASIFVTHSAAASNSEIVTEILSENIDAEFKRHEASGDQVILWIAPEYGFNEGQYEMAELLSKQGIEVWMFNIAESLFMTKGSLVMKGLTGDYVKEAISVVHKKTKKKVTVVSSFYGSIPVLRGIRRWQQSTTDHTYLNGAILFSPALYDAIPPLGEDPTYLPIADAINIPIMIFQGGNIGSRWQLPILLNKLYRSNSQTYVQIMHGISSLFFNHKKTKYTYDFFKNMPLKIKTAINVLNRNTVPSSVLAKKDTGKPKQGIDIDIKPYQGNIKAIPFNLNSITNKRYNRKNFKGKVTLINFWATWCPPCVKEIPSLNKLAKDINHPDFEILSINFAEPTEIINKFLTQFKVDFPILLDSDGSLSRKWKIIVFPSTYILDKKGEIRYGVNAAIEWDSENVKTTIMKLLNE